MKELIERVEISLAILITQMEIWLAKYLSEWWRRKRIFDIDVRVTCQISNIDVIFYLTSTHAIHYFYSLRSFLERKKYNKRNEIDKEIRPQTNPDFQLVNEILSMQNWNLPNLSCKHNNKNEKWNSSHLS
jgi:hypothetical protein